MVQNVKVTQSAITFKLKAHTWNVNVFLIVVSKVSSLIKTQSL